MNLIRRSSQFERLPPREPRFHVQLSRRFSEPERLQGGDEPAGILAGGTDEGIEILAIPRDAVHGYGLAADDDVIDLMPIQAVAERFEIGLDVTPAFRHQ